MKITVALQNLQAGGGHRWPLLRDRLATARPDIVLVNEALAPGWAENGEQLRGAERDLGLTALPPPPSRSGYHVAVLYRRDVLGEPQDYNTDFSDQATHGVCVAAWDAGLTAPFSVCVTHLSPFSPLDALAEAQRARWTALRHGPFAVIAADFNAPPLSGPGADLARMSVLDRAARFTDRDCRIPDTSVAETFARVGFVDTADILFEQTGDEQFRHRTGRSDRIDRILATGPLRHAVAGGALLDAPGGAADHHGLSVTFNLAHA
jgi:endonuclease/exonuclease/phosphatase family metal-dependent hydrolase